MTHALAEPACTCDCGCCLRWHQPEAERALAAATQVGEGVDPYPFLIPEPILGVLPDQLAQARACWKCGRTCRGPMFPIDVGDTVRMVGSGCFANHVRAARNAGAQPLPMED